MKRNKNAKKRRKLSFYKIIGIFLLIMSIVFGIFVSIMDILPLKYFILLTAILATLNITIDIFLFRKKTKKYKKRIASFFAIIFIALMIFVSSYLYKTIEFLSGIGVLDYKVENYSVIVLKDSKYKKINDIKGLKIGYYENTTGISDALKELDKSVSCDQESYNNLTLFAQDLIDTKVDSLLVEESILNMLYEDNENFENSVRVIHTFKVKIKTENDAKEVNVVKEPFNVYITGIDTYGEISSVSRSDVNIVMTVNPSTKQILLTSIPRDYYVQLHGTKGSKDKLTHAGIYGTDMSISTIEDLLGIEINYYLKVNFSSFVDIVNALGGIEAYSKYSFTSIDGYSYKEGYNKMNGEEALPFARARKAFAEGDRQRGADQQAVIEAVINKACSKEILSKYSSLLDSIEGEFETNMGRKKITSLIKMQLSDMSKWTITSISLDGFNGSEVTYTGGNQKLYVMIPDEETVKQASKLINDVIKGEKLTGSYEMKRGNAPAVSKTTTKEVSQEKNNTKEDVKEEEDKSKQKEQKVEEKDSNSKNNIKENTKEDNNNSEIKKEDIESNEIDKKEDLDNNNSTEIEPNDNQKGDDKSEDDNIDSNESLDDKQNNQIQPEV